MLRVKITAKGGTPMELDFDQPRMSIGRGSENDIQLPSNNVSKHHATLHVQNDEITLVDEGSTNGTYVEAERLAGARRVFQHEAIHIGEFTLEVFPLSEPGPTQVITLGEPAATAKPSAPRGPQVTVNPWGRKD